MNKTQELSENIKVCPICSQKFHSSKFVDHVESCNGSVEIHESNKNDIQLCNFGRNLFKHAQPPHTSDKSTEGNNISINRKTSTTDESLHQPVFSYSLVNSNSYHTTVVSTSNLQPSIIICSGNLTTQQVDVIVVCSSSEYLFKSICKVGGPSIETLFQQESIKVPKSNIISIASSGKIIAKRMYFLEWKANRDETILRKSIENFVSDAINQAIKEKYRSIAFPAIGCGRFGCSVSLIAEAMIAEAKRKITETPISVVFVIQPERNDIYLEFQKQHSIIQQPVCSLKMITTMIGKGTIEVEQGDITKQNVDVIISSTSSANLMRAILNAAGSDVQNAYNTECQTNDHAIFLSTESGHLPCKRIFFLDWNLHENEAKLQQFITDRIWLIMQHTIQYKFTSIAFPAIGCGQHGCPTDIIVKTLVKQLKSQLLMRDLSIKIKFIIQPDQENIYDEFCKQVLTTENDNVNSADSTIDQLPLTWTKSNDNKLHFEILNTTDEYKLIFNGFHQTIGGQYTQIVQIERIQNERWYLQYLAHSQDFHKRLKSNTEQRLYHGCPETAVNLIIEDCFNRSFAGKNGTAYGVGVYFSSNASYSHRYAIPNAKGERHMFVARVLVGKTIRGNGSMKTRPLGFDSTTDDKHIFVTYHDAQAYAEYLITYR